MKFLKRFFIVLVVLLIVLGVVGFFLPQTAHVERKVIIDANINTVFEQVNSMRNFHAWSPWTEKDPNAEYVFNGPLAGQGSKMAWVSQLSEVGQGSQEIVESTYPTFVKTELYFGEDPNPGFASFRLEEISLNETQVIWSFDADFGNNVIGRYFGLMMDGMLGPEYEKGLENLKNKL